MNRNLPGPYGMSPRMGPISASDRIAFELESARNNTGLIGRWIHSHREKNATAALAATKRRLDTEESATQSATKAVEAYGALETAVLKANIQSELAVLFHQVAREEAMVGMQTRLARAEEAQLIAQRDVASARNGLDATVALKELNLSIGVARKEAAIAETRELTRPVPKDEPEEADELAELLRIRTYLRARGLNAPQGLNGLIDKLRNKEEPATSE